MRSPTVIIDPENDPTRHYKFIRPHLLKLLCNWVLVYISVRAYLSFTDSQTSYSDFLDILEKDKIVVDIKTVNSSSNCDTGYTQMQSVFFPAINTGCRCDNLIFNNEGCAAIIQNLGKVNFTSLSQKCRTLDNNATPTSTRSLANSTADGYQCNNLN